MRKSEIFLNNLDNNSMIIAHVSRPTFYHYFTDKYNLSNCLYDKLLSETYNDILADRDFRKYFFKSFLILKNNQAILEHLFANPDDQNSLYSYCIKSNLERFKSFLNMKLISNEQLIQLHTYVVGSTYVGWQIVIGDFEMSLEEGVNYLINNIPDFIKTVLQID